MNIPRIFIDDVDVTRYVQKNDFPDGLEESLKGTGYHEYQVSPFTFKIFTGDGSVSFARYSKVLIKDIVSDTVLLRGFIDWIEDELSVTPSVTVFPNALLLKDTDVGDEIDTGDDELVREFDTGSAINVRSIIQQLITAINAQIGSNFKVSTTTCPDPPNETNNRFFGNILFSISQGGFLWNLIQAVFKYVGLSDGGEFRKKSGIYYFVKRDAGIFSKRWLKEGDWLNWTFKKTWKILGTEFGFNFGTFRVPNRDIHFLTIGATYRVYRCVAGGFNDEPDVHDWAPLAPFFDAVPVDLTSRYGSKVSGFTTSNVNTNKVKSFIKESGFANDRDITAGFDLDIRNTYVLANARKSGRLWSSTLVMSFETAFDFAYHCTYRNSNGMNIMRDLAIVTNRWFYVDVDDYIWLLPRNETIGTVNLNRRFVLKLKRKRHKEDEMDITVNLYQESNGQVSSYGIRLRKNEYEAVQNFYKTIFQGERLEDSIEVLKPPIDLGMMKGLAINDVDYGKVISSKKSFLEPVYEIKAEQYV